MTENVPDRERRRAGDLRTGDHIIPGDLIGATKAEEVLGVYQFPDYNGYPSVLLVLREVGRDEIFTAYRRADESIALVSEGADVPAGVVGGPVIGRATVPQARP